MIADGGDRGSPDVIIAYRMETWRGPRLFTVTVTVTVTGTVTGTGTLAQAAMAWGLSPATGPTGVWLAMGASATFQLTLTLALTRPPRVLSQPVVMERLASSRSGQGQALIAETRVSSVVTARRTASLERRTPDRYLPPVNRWLLPAAAVTCLALTGISTVTGSVSSGRSVTVWIVAGIGLPAVVALVARRILLRSQPQVSLDVLAADEAIRRRSLQVVTASAITLLLYCIVDQLLSLLNRSDSGAAAAVVLILIGAVAVPVTGWRLAGGRAPA